jgi:hypothetical protein
MARSAGDYVDMIELRPEQRIYDRDLGIGAAPTLSRAGLVAVEAGRGG